MAVHVRTIGGEAVKIQAHRADGLAPYLWIALRDNYDGAPDAGFQPSGTGDTEDDAVADLVWNIEELA